MFKTTKLGNTHTAVDMGMAQIAGIFEERRSVLSSLKISAGSSPAGQPCLKVRAKSQYLFIKGQIAILRGDGNIKVPDYGNFDLKRWGPVGVLEGEIRATWYPEYGAGLPPVKITLLSGGRTLWLFGYDNRAHTPWSGALLSNSEMKALAEKWQ